MELVIGSDCLTDGFCLLLLSSGGVLCVLKLRCLHFYRILVIHLVFSLLEDVGSLGGCNRRFELLIVFRLHSTHLAGGKFTF